MIKTKWDFSIFKRKNFKTQRKIILRKIENFYNQWSKRDLKKPKNLFKFLKDCERFIYKTPTIFAEEYTYYFLKTLLDTKNKKYKIKLNEIEKLKEKAYKKIFSLLGFLKNCKEKNKILNSPQIKNYKNFLETFLVEPLQPFKNGKFATLRSKIDEEIKKTNWKIYEDKNLQDRILKKYSGLMEKALNEILKVYLEKERKEGLSFTYYDKFLAKGFDPKIIKIIKEVFLENKENLKKELKKYELSKEEKDVLFSLKIPLKKGIYLAIEIFNKIDKSLGKFVLESFQKGLVDVYPRKNKYLLPRVVSGSPLLPTFILLNYKNTLKDFLSLIHEFSHAFHNEFLKKYNSPFNSNQSSIVKETVAAIFILFALEVLKEKHNNLIEKYMHSDFIKTTLNDLVIFSIQEEIYKIYKTRGEINIKEINKIYKKNILIFFGKTKAREISNYRWILNFYRGLAFWHFPYFIGGILSRIFIKEYYKNKKEFKKKLFKFLRAGANKTFEEILKKIGYDVYKKDFWGRCLT